jgi:hypothetical protein
LSVDFLLFWVALPLDPQGFDPAASGDFHLLHRDLGISMGLLVAVEPSGKRLPSEESSSIIALRGYQYIKHI